jgi:hypothetical protein
MGQSSLLVTLPLPLKLFSQKPTEILNLAIVQALADILRVYEPVVNACLYVLFCSSTVNPSLPILTLGNANVKIL